MNDDAARDLRRIADALSSCEQVTRYNVGDEKEAWTLAHDFLDLESSFKVFLNEMLPKLRSSDLKRNEVQDLLLEIGEELRHVLYHIQNSRYYRYVWETEP